MELKIPPVALVLMTAGLMAVCAWGVPSLTWANPDRILAGAGLALVGGIVCLCGVISFRRAKTTVNPMKPDAASSLVVVGIYKVSRNPMYLGFLLILLGLAAYLSNGPALVPVVAFVLYIDRYQIRPEERALDARFGQEYAGYKEKVRRWI